MDKEIKFADLFDLRKIQKLQNSFAKATGVGAIITDPAGNPITKPSNFCRLCSDVIRNTEKGLDNCIKLAKMGHYSPEGPIIQPCFNGGLWDAISGIRAKDKHIANWIVGQVRNEAYSEEELLKFAREIGADEKEFLSALPGVTVMPLKQFKEIANAVFLMSNQMSQMAFQNIRHKELSQSLIQEITERKKAEEDARAAKERMETWDKYMIFTLGDGEFGISISHIHEVITIMPVTSVPEMPYHMKGVVNLRGRIIPVTDLRMKLGLDETDYTDQTCIIIINIESAIIGVVVDSVKGVMNIRVGDIEDAPEFGAGINPEYILGIAMNNGKIKILIDIHRIFSLEEINDFERTD
ncbi:MAG: hypothetical protein GY795_34115 [Desulfobacterales bacterium]|nr:hypothetical protein [Desulfobacterales bacterium]